MVKYDRYPGGKRYALTFSYDDGGAQDRRLVELFNKYGMKCTFNVMSSSLKNENGKGVKIDEVKSLYEGHEIAVHTVNHLHLERMAPVDQYREIFDDKIVLEEACGEIVRGLAYPFGTYNNDTLNVMDVCGIVYGRTNVPTNSFLLPENFKIWNPTCHHNECEPMVKRFEYNATKAPWRAGGVLYIWGHSYELDNDEAPTNWERFEAILQRLSALKDNVWFATNIEIYDYMNAIKSLRRSADGTTFYNPTDTTVCISNNDEPVEIEPMTKVRIEL